MVKHDLRVRNLTASSWHYCYCTHIMAQQKKVSVKNNAIGVCIVFGVALGSALGLLIDNAAIGIAGGIVLGIIAGAVTEKKRV